MDLCGSNIPLISTCSQRRLRSSSQQPAYQYTSLLERQIRLVTLHPSNDPSSLIHVDIHHVELSDQVRFHALSYVWGDTSNLIPVSSAQGLLLITTNLRDALLQIRRDNVIGLRLWIDTLCINQHDDSEKGAQIAMMKDIFQAATCTIIWLGRHADNSVLAVKYLQWMDARLNKLYVDWSKLGRPVDIETLQYLTPLFFLNCGKSLARLFGEFAPHETQSAIAHLLARPWFRRSWVIQEYVVSEKLLILCGDALCSFDIIFHLFEFSFVEANLTWSGVIQERNLRQEFCGGLQQLYVMRMHHQKYHGRFHDEFVDDLLDHLTSYRLSQATKPEDKVWSLLGLSENEEDRAFFYPLHGLSAPELYTQVAAYIVGSGRGVSVLAQAIRSPRRSSSGAPSWVPDWSEGPTCTAFNTRMTGDGLKFQAGGNANASINLTNESPASSSKGKHVLCSKGVITHVIVGTSDTDVMERTCAPNLDAMVDTLSVLWAYIKNWPTVTYGNGEDLVSIMSAICHAGQINNSSADYRDVVWDIFNELEFGVPLSLSSEVTEVVNILRAAHTDGKLKYIQTALAGRKPAVCYCVVPDSPIKSKHFLGLVPKDARTRDRICILEGYGAPLVIGPTEGRAFTLVGDCYVHGIMNGEMANLSDWYSIEIA